MDAKGENSLALFPAKFRESMWIRRGTIPVPHSFTSFSMILILFILFLLEWFNLEFNVVVDALVCRKLCSD